MTFIINDKSNYFEDVLSESPIEKLFVKEIIKYLETVSYTHLDVYKRQQLIEFDDIKKQILVPSKLIDGSFQSRNDIFTSSIMNIIDSLRNLEVSNDLIQKFIRDFTAKIIYIQYDQKSKL